MSEVGRFKHRIANDDSSEASCVARPNLPKPCGRFYGDPARINS